MKTSLAKLLAGLIATWTLLGATAHANILDLNTVAYDSIVAGNDPFPGSQDYFADKDGNTSGPLSAYITTVIAGKTVTATWDPAGSITFDWLHIKSGNGYVVWNFNSFDWSPYSGFTYTNDDITNGNTRNPVFVGISHVDGGGSHNEVPEGGTTAVLLGSALIAASMIARRRSA
ncbi:MAG TPA: hypothetical protein VIM71_03780 [Lacunisphaera sp.]